MVAFSRSPKHPFAVNGLATADCPFHEIPHTLHSARLRIDSLIQPQPSGSHHKHRIKGQQWLKLSPVAFPTSRLPSLFPFPQRGLTDICGARNATGRFPRSASLADSLKSVIASLVTSFHTLARQLVFIIWCSWNHSHVIIHHLWREQTARS